MNKNLLIIFLIVVIAIAMSLSLFDNTGRNNKMEPQATATEEVIEKIETSNEMSATIIGSWEWQSTTMNDDSKVTPSTPGKFVLTFNADGNFNTTTDCNSGMGTYTLGENGSITFGPIASTKMYCENSNEDKYFSDLNEVQMYMVEGDFLTLLLKYDTVGMNFTRIQ